MNLIEKYVRRIAREEIMSALADPDTKLTLRVGEEELTRAVNKNNASLPRHMEEEGASITNVPTCDLVAELKRREGVEHVDISPYANATTKAEGPAIVLIVTD